MPVILEQHQLTAVQSFGTHRVKTCIFTVLIIKTLYTQPSFKFSIHILHNISNMDLYVFEDPNTNHCAYGWTHFKFSILISHNNQYKHHAFLCLWRSKKIHRTSGWTHCSYKCRYNIRLLINTNLTCSTVRKREQPQTYWSLHFHLA